MTKSRVVNTKFVPGTWQGSRSAHTLLLQMAADAEKLAAQGDRIKQLRLQRRTTDDGKRLTQEAVAAAVRVTTRAYQEWEAGRGDIKPENVQALADFYGTSPDFIEYGSAEPAATPDALAALNGNGNGSSEVLARLDVIEKTLAQILRNQEEWLALIGVGAKRENYFTMVQRTLDTMVSQLAAEADQPRPKPSTGPDHSPQHAA